jgi:hypothetical protein
MGGSEGWFYLIFMRVLCVFLVCDVLSGVGGRGTFMYARTYVGDESHVV